MSQITFSRFPLWTNKVILSVLLIPVLVTEKSDAKRVKMQECWGREVETETDGHSDSF